MHYANKLDSAVATFNWARNHLFDRLSVLALYEICMENPRALIVSVKQKETKKLYTHSYSRDLLTS